MQAKEYLKYIVEQIHSTIFATVDKKGLPITCAIDIMDYDDSGLYFLTAKGKSFYEGLVRYMTEGDVKGIYKFDATSITMQVSSNLNESEESFITRTRALVKEVIRPKFALKREDFKGLSNEDFEELTKTANVLHASDSPASAEREIKNLF